MKLSQCKIGEVVQAVNDSHIGHIIGLTMNQNFPGAINTDGETVPIVQWSYSNNPTIVHHKNLNLYKD